MQITEYDRTEAQIETRKQRLSELIQMEGHLEHRKVRAEEHGTKLAAWRGGLQKDLYAVAQDLQAIRMMAPSEQTLQMDDIKVSFSKINQAICDLAYEMIYTLPQDPLRSRLRDAQLESRRVDSEPIDDFLDFSFHHHGGLPIRSVAQYMLIHQMCSDIWRDIYSSFAPGISSVDDKVLTETYSAMEKAETQERVGRWRAMTYSHLKIERRICNQSASDTMGIISSLLGIFPGLESSSSILKPFTEKMAAVYMLALDFQERTQTLCTDVNTKVSMSTDNARWIKVFDGTGEPTKIVLPIGLGLFTSKVARHKDGSIEIKKGCLYPLLVIADDWAPVERTE